ncbi:hypothetical protein C0J45_23195 [Silurus meridionalis]|nr:hypothetical protein C0J45_23195 [Silurus meridionalis]
MTQLYTLLYIVRYTTLILTVVTVGSFADKIGPVDKNAYVFGKETDTVTLKCSYESSSRQIPRVILNVKSACFSDSMGDSINPSFTHEVVKEGDDVTLSCNYSTSATYSYLHWYRQHPKSNPKFLLYTHDTTGGKSDSIPPRLDVKVDKKNKQVNLIISSAAVSDSGLYYCALVPTVTGNLAALYKNLHTVMLY